jgi:glycerol uptake facilitator-like aquaporin
MQPARDLPRRAAAEAIGTLLLVATVVGSGIMAERLGAGGALALLTNSLATGAVLVALIAALAPVSGAHLNPAVTLAAAWLGRSPWPEAAVYVAAQCAGGLAGTAIAHAMFDLPLFVAGEHVRSGSPQWLGEFVATFGLVAVVAGTARAGASIAPFAVAGWIVAAYWFTSSTSFANPAVTLARAATDTFAGIRPADVPAFATAQLLGAFAGAALLRWLGPEPAAAQSPARQPGSDFTDDRRPTA